MYDDIYEFECGSDRAYAHGEKPITYWHKKTILFYVKHFLAEYRKTTEGARKYNNLLRDTNLTHEEVISQLEKTKLDKLQSKLLEKTDTHLTGSFYMNKLRHTRFFKVVEGKILLGRLKGYILKPKIVEQLTIRGIDNGINK